MDKLLRFTVIALSCSGFCCFGANVGVVSQLDQADGVTAQHLLALGQFIESQARNITTLTERIYRLEGDVTAQQMLTANQSQQIITLTERNEHLEGDVTAQQMLTANQSQQITTLTERNERLEGDVTAQQMLTANQSQHITTLTERNERLEGDVTAQQMLTANQSQQITTLTDRNERLEGDVTAQQMLTANQARQITTLTERLPRHISETRPVAFTAFSRTGEKTRYRNYGVVRFNRVLTNLGGHYNAATSKFTCPTNGVYLVSVSVQAYTSEYAGVKLMRGNAELARAWADNVDDAANKASTTVITECSRGDVLYVRPYHSSSYLYAPHGYHNVFTGHLIARL